MSFEVRITGTASRDIAERYDRISNWASPAAADRWRTAILAAVDTLEQMPRRCGEAPEAEWLAGEVRQLLYGRRRNVYRILFRIQGNTVYVMHVRHGREDLIRPDDA